MSVPFTAKETPFGPSIFNVSLVVPQPYAAHETKSILASYSRVQSYVREWCRRHGSIQVFNNLLGCRGGHGVFK